MQWWIASTPARGFCLLTWNVLRSVSKWSSADRPSTVEARASETDSPVTEAPTMQSACRRFMQGTPSAKDESEETIWPPREPRRSVAAEDMAFRATFGLESAVRLP